MATGRVGLNPSAVKLLQRGCQRSPKLCSWAGCPRGGSRSNRVPNPPWGKEAQKSLLLGHVLGVINDLKCWSQWEICLGFCRLQVKPIWKARFVPGQGPRWVWRCGNPGCSFGAALGLSRAQWSHRQWSHGHAWASSDLSSTVPTWPLLLTAPYLLPGLCQGVLVG